MKGACFKLKGDFEGPPYQDAVWGASYADLKCLIYRRYGTGTIPSRSRKSSFRYSPTQPNLDYSSQLCPSAGSHPLVSSYFFFFSAGMVQCACESERVCAFAQQLGLPSDRTCRDLAYLCRIFVRRTCPIGAFSSSPPANPTPLTSPTPSSNRIRLVPGPASPFSRSLHASPRVRYRSRPPEFTMATGMIWACTPSRLYYTL